MRAPCWSNRRLGEARAGERASVSAQKHVREDAPGDDNMFENSPAPPVNVTVGRS